MWAETRLPTLDFSLPAVAPETSPPLHGVLIQAPRELLPLARRAARLASTAPFYMGECPEGVLALNTVFDETEGLSQPAQTNRVFPYRGRQRLIGVIRLEGGEDGRVEAHVAFAPTPVLGIFEPPVDCSVPLAVAGWREFRVTLGGIDDKPALALCGLQRLILPKDPLVCYDLGDVAAAYAGQDLEAIAIAFDEVDELGPAIQRATSRTPGEITLGGVHLLLDHRSDLLDADLVAGLFRSAWRAADCLLTVEIDAQSSVAASSGDKGKLALALGRRVRSRFSDSCLRPANG